jgi:Ca2+-binding RTX toxin-like protein
LEHDNTGEAADLACRSKSMAVIFGTQGRDTLDGTGLDDIIQGWAKDRDALTDLGDELRGFGGEDRLWGRGGKDDLSGGDNRDRLFGGTGNDSNTELAVGAGMLLGAWAALRAVSGRGATPSHLRPSFVLQVVAPQ